MIFLAFAAEKDMFAMPSRDVIEKLATKILIEKFDTKVDDVEGETSDDEEKIEISTASTFAQSLQEKINAKKKNSNQSAETLPLKNVLKSEMKLYEISGQKGELLTKVDLTLKNISPTSIGKIWKNSILHTIHLYNT